MRNLKKMIIAVVFMAMLIDQNPLCARDSIALQNERLEIECKANMPITIRVEGGLVIQNFLHDKSIEIANVKTNNGGVSQILNTNLKDGEKIPLTMILDNGFSQDLMLVIKEEAEDGPIVFRGDKAKNKRLNDVSRDLDIIDAETFIVKNYFSIKDRKQIKNGIFEDKKFQILVLYEHLFSDIDQILLYFSRKKCKSIFWLEPDSNDIKQKTRKVGVIL